jgi:hypothetical protein
MWAASHWEASECGQAQEIVRKQTDKYRRRDFFQFIRYIMSWEMGVFGMYGAFGGYTRWAVVFLIIFVLFFLLVPGYGGGYGAGAGGAY